MVIAPVSPGGSSAQAHAVAPAANFCSLRMKSTSAPQEMCDRSTHLSLVESRRLAVESQLGKRMCREAGIGQSD